MIVVNGQQFTEEEFAQMQEEYFRQQEEQYKQWRDYVKCGYAIIPQTGIAVCGLTRTQVNPDVDCKNCVSYNEKVFEIVEEE